MKRMKMRPLTTYKKVSGSFRDPSGFVFFSDGTLYRQINKSYREHYDKLLNSGLYDNLSKSGLLISHEEISYKPTGQDGYKVIKPEYIEFISYPYEWSFSQLKDAALATLEIQKRALLHGMSLKDCSAYNIQFLKGKPVFIDTLSFEKYVKGKPWIAYRQFCQHFLAPLALMSLKDIRLSQLLRVYMDGIPLDLASSLLPITTFFRFGLFSNIHMHGKIQKHFSHKIIDVNRYKMSELSLRGLIDNLKSTITKLTWNPQGTEWADYYTFTNYSDFAFHKKQSMVDEFIDTINPKSVWDLGANTGSFSRLASRKGILTVAFDNDPASVEKNYLETKEREERNLLPLLLDLTNPSSGIGWHNSERESLFDRGPVDLVLALALIHHLVISNNVPLDKVAEFFKDICVNLIIEFVPKDDSKVQKLLMTREDIFSDYTKESFERAFGAYFQIKYAKRIPDSERILYLMTKK